MESLRILQALLQKPLQILLQACIRVLQVGVRSFLGGNWSGCAPPTGSSRSLGFHPLQGLHSLQGRGFSGGEFGSCSSSNSKYVRLETLGDVMEK